MEQDLFNEFDEVFFTDGYRLANENLTEISKESIIELTNKSYKYTEEIIESFKSQCNKEEVVIECEKKCSFCCYQSVLVAPHEAIYVWHYIKQMTNIEIKEKIFSRIEEKNKKTSKMKTNEFLHFKSPCPFLEGNLCSIYPVRPFGCRLHLSASKKSCKKDYENPADFSIYPDLFEFPLRAGRMINEGICRFLSEKGINSFEWMLESSLSLLANDEEIIEKWLQGENIFQPRILPESEIEYLKKFDLGNIDPGENI